tara:strand:+ start:216 stop:743 length:528 start_codon:yes stop_codon:yes gene_type:complete
MFKKLSIQSEELTGCGPKGANGGHHGGGGDDPIDFSTLSEPWGVALEPRTEGGTFCQPNGPDGYYSNNFDQRISFEAPAGKRIRFTVTLAHLDDNWQYGIKLRSPIGGGNGESLTSPVNIYGDSTAGTDFFSSHSVPFVAETPVGQNTADFWFTSNYFSHQVRPDGEWRVTVEFF